MRRTLSLVAIAACLAVPVAAGASDPRLHSPSRSLLGQLIDLPVVRSGFRNPYRIGVDGDWHVVALRSDRLGMEPVAPARGQFLRIDHGWVAFSMGCNQFVGHLGIGPLGRVSVGPLRGTRMACPHAEARIERRMVEALAEAARAEVTHRRLILTDRFGRPLVELERGRVWHGRHSLPQQ